MAAVQSGFAAINGLQMYYEVAGAGQPVVFVHAGVADNRLWDEQFALFAQHYKVVRFDLRGFGKTEPVDNEYTNRGDILALLDHLGISEPAHFIGCSMGGGFSMDITVRYPERVRSLTMVCSGPPGLWIEIAEPPIFAEAEAAFEAGDWDKALELETRCWVDGVDRAPEQVDPLYRAKAVEMNRVALAHKAKGLGKNLPGEPPYAGERLEEIKVPVLLVLTEFDTPYSAAAAEIMMQRINNCRQVLIANAAHLPSLEHPAEFNRIVLDFLRETAKA